MKIRKCGLKVSAKQLVCFVLIWTIISGFLIDEIGISRQITYLNDFLWLILLILVVKKNFTLVFKRYGLRSIILCLGWYTLIVFFSIILNFVNPVLFLWAFRNGFRFFVYYIACICYLDDDDVDRLFDVMFFLHIINFILAIYQFLVLGLNMDYLGGIFGHGNGGVNNLFMVMLYCYFLWGYIVKKKSFFKVVFILVTSLIIAALAEEKAFFVYIIISTTIIIILNRPRIRSLLIITGIIMTIPIAVDILVATNESWNLEVITNFERMIEYGNTSYGLSRINPFGQIKEMFFGDSIIKNLFGLGFGNCEYSDGIAIFNSEFYKRYSYLQYYDFVHQMKFLETGILGFCLYLIFFIVNVVNTIKQLFKSKIKDYRYQFGIAYTIVVITSFWFSVAALRAEAYIIYFGIAVASIIKKSQYKGK